VQRKGTPRTSNDNLLPQSHSWKRRVRRVRAPLVCPTSDAPIFHQIAILYLIPLLRVYVGLYQRERYRLPRKLNSLPHHNIYNTHTHSLYIFLIEKPCKMVLIWRRRDGASALVFQVLGFTHHARSSSQNVREILYLNKANGGGSECCVLYLLRREYIACSVCVCICDVV
jgi:hypothetical protein